MPWEGYNSEFIFLLNQVIGEPDTRERQMLVKQLHPKEETPNDRTVRLRCRNIGIIAGTEFVIALPNWDKLGGRWRRYGHQGAMTKYTEWLDGQFEVLTISLTNQ